jgi:hypothetical protein
VWDGAAVTLTCAGIPVCTPNENVVACAAGAKAAVEIAAEAATRSA